jgi:hypothetical protein
MPVCLLCTVAYVHPNFPFYFLLAPRLTLFPYPISHFSVSLLSTLHLSRLFPTVNLSFLISRRSTLFRHFPYCLLVFFYPMSHLSRLVPTIWPLFLIPLPNFPVLFLMFACLPLPHTLLAGIFPFVCLYYSTSQPIRCILYCLPVICYSIYT